MFWLNITLIFSASLLIALLCKQFFKEATTHRIHANRGKVLMIVGIIVVVLIYLLHQDLFFKYDIRSVMFDAFFVSFFATGWSGYMTYHKNEENMFKHKMFAYLSMGLMFVNLIFGIEYLIKLII